MNDPLVSVVIAVRNGAQYIALTLKSALAQSYSNLEILVIDHADKLPVEN